MSESAEMATAPTMIWGFGAPAVARSASPMQSAAATVRTTPIASPPAQNVATELPHVSRASATTAKSPRVLIDMAPWYHAPFLEGAQGSNPTQVRHPASIRFTVLVGADP